MPANIRFHRNIRLSPESYRGRQFYFVTLCCQKRRNIFADKSRCQWLLDSIRGECAARHFAVHAYCVMPDHFHFLLEGLTVSSDLLGLVKSFKIRSSRAYLRKMRRILWQKKFYDHILRGNEAPEAVAWYIWTNPVRKGLSSAVGEYAFAGSFTGLMARVKPGADLWSPPWKLQKAPASEGGLYNGAKTPRI